MTVKSHQVTCIAPVNIAVVKYWGKRDTKLILPTNSSLSVTLDTADLHSKTSVCASPDFPEDRFWLNGKEESIVGNSRFSTCVANLRQRRFLLENEGKVTNCLSDWKLHIVSENNFPTAAGLASSASGLACLVYSLARLFELVDERSTIDAYEELSKYARMGSGSACRSIFGGFVKWEMGCEADGSDSKAVQVAPKSHWSNMRALILVVNDAKKDISSTAGMQTTVETSSLFQHRISYVVPERMRDMENAILERDFETFGRLTMQDSNQFHAVCADTYPPVYYMNDTSRTIVNFVTALNNTCGKIVAAYTFDAGPNAVLYILDENFQLVLMSLNRLLNGLILETCGQLSHVEVPDSVSKFLAFVRPLERGLVKRVIFTSVGNGPEVLESDMSLLGVDGFPLFDQK